MLCQTHRFVSHPSVLQKVKCPGHNSGTQLLDIMATTLRESWGLLLSLEVPQSYLLEPSDKDEHWKNQTELHLKFLSDFWDSDNGFLDRYQFGVLKLAQEFLTKELQFQAKFEVEAREFLEECSSGHEIYNEVVDLLEYLLTTQAALVRRLGEVMAELKSQSHLQAKQQARGSLITA